MLFQPYPVVVAQTNFRQKHSGEGHKIERKSEPFIPGQKPPCAHRVITTCSCGKEGQMTQIMDAFGNYEDPR